VVELPSGSADLQLTVIDLLSTDVTKSATISQVDLAKTFIAHGGAQYTLGSQRHLSQLKFTGNTTVQALRQSIGSMQAMTVVAQVVELLDNSLVEAGAVQIAAAATAPTSQPSFTEVANGTVISTHAYGNQYISTGAVDLTPTHWAATILLDDPPDGLTIQRVGTSQALEVSWFVVDWAGAGETVLPGALLASSNLRDSGLTTPPADLSDLTDDPGSPDADWWTAVSPSAATEARWSFASPTSGIPEGVQTIRLWLRKTTGGGTPTVDIELWESGSFVATLLDDYAITSTTGQLVEATFDLPGSPALLADPTGAGVEIRLVSTPGAV
jgi:hypothetical protein